MVVTCVITRYAGVVIHRLINACPLLALSISAAVAAAPQRAAPNDAATAAMVPAGVPNVFRCIFEDQARMVIIRPAPDLWVAFNPATCTIDKIWRGGMKFRGKVWDFSQDNCSPSDDAEVWAERDRTLARLPDDRRVPEGWTLDGIEPLPGGGWRFAKSGASIISPPMDACGAMVAFDETGRASPFKVDVSTDDGKSWTAQSFLSTMHGTSDAEWQFNFREISPCHQALRVRVQVDRPGATKSIRNLRLMQTGLTASWSSSSQAFGDKNPVRWRGYERSADGSGTVIMLYDVGDPAVRVRHGFAAGQVGADLELYEVITLDHSGPPRLVELIRPSISQEFDFTVRHQAPMVSRVHEKQGQPTREYLMLQPIDAHRTPTYEFHLRKRDSERHP